MTDSDIAIEVEGLNKVYHIYRHPMDLLLEWLGFAPRHQDYRALDNINFTVRRGEVVGILGRNGAGKSTLLKILAGTLRSTSGSVRIEGRVTAILELGTGFHPDYSGRENIFMGGLCLGMTRKEIERKLDEIIAFSELEEHIDNEFRTYSSGMQARLTFSTAAAVDPDILIIDEALSVGDARFQMKCFDRIRRLREQGKTILLVSHDVNTITNFCDRALIVESGRIHAEGEPKAMVKEYLHLLFGEAAKGAMTANADDEGGRPRDAAGRFGDGAAMIEEYDLVGSAGEPARILQSGSRCRLFFKARVERDVTEWSGGFAIKDVKGTYLWGLTNISQRLKPEPLKKGEHLEVGVDFTLWLADGDYAVQLGLGHAKDGKMIDFIYDAIHFRVLGPDGIFENSIVNLDSTLAVALTCREEGVAGQPGMPISEQRLIPQGETRC